MSAESALVPFSTHPITGRAGYRAGGSEKSDGVNMTPLRANISPKWGHDVREDGGLIACGRGLPPRVVSPLMGL